MNNLQTIREAVFKSIPGIEYRWADYDSPNTETTAAMIGLADVLRAIELKYPNAFYGQGIGIQGKIVEVKDLKINDGFRFAYAIVPLIFKNWNLAKSLNDQDEPTLKYLAEILK